MFGRFGDVADSRIDGLPDSAFVTDVGGFRTIFVVDVDQPDGVNVSGGPVATPTRGRTSKAARR